MEDQCYNEVYVGKVIEQFMDLTYHDFAANVPPDLMESSTDAIFGINEISETARENFNYTDMCLLLDDIGRNQAYTTYLERIHRTLLNTEFQKFSFRMWNEMLLSASRGLIEAKLFLVLPMEWFCRYLIKNAPDSLIIRDEVEELKKLVREVYRTTGKELTGSATIEEVLLMARSVTREYWRPDGASLEAYQKRILTAYSAIANLLIYSFKAAYPERFGIEDVIWNE